MEGVKQCLKDIFEFPVQAFSIRSFVPFFLRGARKGPCYPQQMAGPSGDWRKRDGNSLILHT